MKNEAGSDIPQPGPKPPFDESRYRRILGDELCATRRRAGLSRPQLSQHLVNLGYPAAPTRTIESYEFGDRNITVARLSELCLAMGTTIDDLLQRVARRMYDDDAGEVLVDLNQLATADDSRPLPLRRWADSYAKGLAKYGNSAQAWLGPTALEHAADLCGLDLPDLIALLPNVH